MGVSEVTGVPLNHPLQSCHKPPMTGNGNHTTYKNGDDWGVASLGYPLTYPWLPWRKPPAAGPPWRSATAQLTAPCDCPRSNCRNLEPSPRTPELLRIAADRCGDICWTSGFRPLIFTSKVLEVQINHGTFNVAPPPVISWFISPSNYSYLRTRNHSEIGVMCTNWMLSWPGASHCLDVSKVKSLLTSKV